VRVAFAIVVATGCGRVGFDVQPDATIVLPLGSPCVADYECGRCARCESVCQAEPVGDVALGHRSLCYLGANGSRWCSGENTQGDLGLGDSKAHVLPKRNVGEDGWTVLSPAYHTALGLRSGDLWSWPDSASLPTDTGPATNVVEILGEDATTCVHLVGDTYSCDPSMTVWKAFAFGDDHRCGIKADGSLWCAGTDTSGDLGQGTGVAGMVLPPTQVGVATDWIAVSAGEPVSCALKMAGTIYCWGEQSLSGTNGVDPMGMPTQVGTDTDWASIKGDYHRTCATKLDGSIWCWGSDSNGFIIPGQFDAPVPMQVPGTFDRFVLGGHHACGHSNGSWQCYGWNAAGQLGIGNANPQPGFVALCPF
jgi:hypothetical protein